MAKRKIIWSHIAKLKVFEILAFYTKRNKSPRYSTKLYKRFNKELALVDSYPELGMKTDFAAVRGLIVEDFILFYEVTSSNIIVHTVWDCRQNPKDLKIK
ncbi:type II toxin-antitoxin system RelE/ParE family toxin [Mangrovibacterium marinum]|uniref:ParE-like toxin of type II ParDE toxin-antitoxin system n=1 Tax=Mangrovibacterium marinum TaxID=1639118 RepID=A0A2T5BZS7_9BACT|nr:type II toxin-antitoxin system RelE/ParE family toxin [Mangrovibacterium marinum]PTN07809.1 ParE-like toxin of type II ParDE toxin-antitoxin system [Mangrovibacterium marinum]